MIRNLFLKCFGGKAIIKNVLDEIFYDAYKDILSHYEVELSSEKARSEAEFVKRRFESSLNKILLKH